MPLLLFQVASKALICKVFQEVEREAEAQKAAEEAAAAQEEEAAAPTVTAASERPSSRAEEEEELNKDLSILSVCIRAHSA